ncbi:YciI family protein [Pseudorhodoplanes sp.]|uniref:YciI family protein n=1 Tax=Pseudorhodoplanes sp. TaxID=1934341 RepID=UPI003919560E
MPSAAQMKIAELTKGMLKLKLFVIFSQGKGLDVTPYLAEHLEYMIALERQGKLFASGPLGDPAKADGMTIVRAADEEDARGMALRDPFVIHGIRTFKIVPWTVMEGSLSVTVNFSDQTAKIS